MLAKLRSMPPRRTSGAPRPGNAPRRPASAGGQRPDRGTGAEGDRPAPCGRPLRRRITRQAPSRTWARRSIRSARPTDEEPSKYARTVENDVARCPFPEGGRHRQAELLRESARQSVPLESRLVTERGGDTSVHAGPQQQRHSALPLAWRERREAIRAARHVIEEARTHLVVERRARQPRLHYLARGNVTVLTHRPVVRMTPPSIRAGMLNPVERLRERRVGTPYASAYTSSRLQTRTLLG